LNVPLTHAYPQQETPGSYDPALATTLRSGRFFSCLGRASWPVVLALCAVLALNGCGRHDFPTYPANYREYAYITNSGSNSVTVLDVVNMRQDRVIRVGGDPVGIVANPMRPDVYVVNSGSGTVSVIDARSNTMAATIPVHRKPYFIDVDTQGKRAYVANSGSDNVSVVDLDARREIGTIGAGQSPGLARISHDGNSLVITNRRSGSVSIADPHTFKVRASFNRCPGATDAIILPDSSKTFVACSDGHQIMVVGLKHTSSSEGQVPDRLLTLLDVGDTPVHLALKPDGGEAFVSNFKSDTLSEIATSSNEVGGAYLVGARPVRGLATPDNSLLYVSNFSAGRVSVYSIDDGKWVGSVSVGEGPDALAFSTNEYFLFVVDSQSGDVAVLRTRTTPPTLFAMFPTGRNPSSIAVKSFRAP
jgi:YVTN family beta-propeller protein